ncbi:diacylglycerol kinase [Pontibacillus halophilus JSM 076056 = DSM 19796]|uniref:Diacylglycerol kinase n=1 Tax=Pontibacillus halophilus JSM 076056 = DSM 19796 TaxID=1385510 RepID=A0A0A5GEK1_9BACI|nr:dihydrofolate reductase family protein [Pontibacillus halophilus]KGX91646.1 diacylglycerol kinase [Pontibacillus halophilus JSM 076056 = DSM 19796]
MRKTVLYIAMSIDGYIAKEDGSVGWLEKVNGKGDNGFSSFIETVDTVLLGSKTYDQVLGFDVPFPYEEQQCFVFSRKRSGQDEYVKFINEDPTEFVQELKEHHQGKKIWLVGGSELIQTFLNHNLIDEFKIAVIPTLLGKGIPLFKSHELVTQLSLEAVEEYNDIVMLHYKNESSLP